jgi:hypothetical protein
VNTLVEQLGGTIELDRGSGTEFRIAFTELTWTLLNSRPSVIVRSGATKQSPLLLAFEDGRLLRYARNDILC